MNVLECVHHRKARLDAEEQRTVAMPDVEIDEQHVVARCVTAQ